jgi:DNA/RNA endonuclease G (NUC1)
MTRDELLLSIDLIEELIPTGKPNRPGTAIAPTTITIHNTSNPTAGADAKAHSSFVRNTGYYDITHPDGTVTKNWVSWHFTVDDKRVIRQLPSKEKAFHAGTQQGNNSSIGIEICMHAGIDQNKANDRAARLIALLCLDLVIPTTAVVTHKSWTNKNCPQLLLPIWGTFVTTFTNYYNSITATSPVGMTALNITPSNGPQLCWKDSSEATTIKVQNGFNDKFLADTLISLPVVANNQAKADYVFLHHQNLTTYFNKVRKLALYTGCNFDKEHFHDITRSNAFQPDSQIDTSFQLADGFYKSKTLNITPSTNYFDRGHIIARRYNQWGENVAEAIRGERDTYYFTAIHPQVKELNQEEWENLESFIIEHGKLDVNRVSVIAGTFLKTDDPKATYTDKLYQDQRTIQIPKLFWKIVYYQVNNELRKISFLMSQVYMLKKMKFVKFPIHALAADPFDKLDDPLKTYVINSSLIEEHTDLAFSQAKELFQDKEPLEVVRKDNETHYAAMANMNNLIQFI